MNLFTPVHEYLLYGQFADSVAAPTSQPRAIHSNIMIYIPRFTTHEQGWLVGAAISKLIIISIRLDAYAARA